MGYVQGMERWSETNLASLSCQILNVPSQENTPSLKTQPSKMGPILSCKINK